MARRAVVQLDIQAGDARKELVTINNLFGRLGEEAVQNVRKVDNAFDGLAPSVERVSQTTRQASESTEALTQSVGRTTGSVSGANQVLFTLGDATQDASIAFNSASSTSDALGNAARFMGNNLAFGAEQVSLLVTRAGSGRAAMSALAGSMLGAGGMIVAVQLAVSVIPALIDLIDSLGDSSLETARKIFGMAENLKEIREAGVGGVLEEIRQDEEARAQAIALLQQRQVELAFQRLDLIQQGVDVQASGFQEVDRHLEGVQIALAALDSEQAAINEKIFQFVDELGLSVEVAGQLVDLLGQAGQQTQELPPEPGTVGATAPTPQELVQLLRTRPGVFGLNPLAGIGPVIGGPVPGTQDGFQTTPQTGGGTLDQQISKVFEVQRAVQLFGLTSQRANQQVRVLEQAVLALSLAGEEGSLTYQVFQQNLAKAREEAEQFEDESNQTARATEQIASTAVLGGLNAVAGALERGADASERMQNALRGIARTVGNQLVRMAIKGSVSTGAGVFGGLLTLGAGLFHEGTDAGFPGIGIVGERGPEAVVAPPMSTIITNKNLEQLASMGTPTRMDRVEHAIHGLARSIRETPPELVIDPLNFRRETNRYDPQA